MLLGSAVSTAPTTALLHVTRDDARMAQLAEAIAFFYPDIECLQFPAWDCLPYDRVENGDSRADAGQSRDVSEQRKEYLGARHRGSTRRAGRAVVGRRMGRG